MSFRRINNEMYFVGIAWDRLLSNNDSWKRELEVRKLAANRRHIEGRGKRVAKLLMRLRGGGACNCGRACSGACKPVDHAVLYNTVALVDHVNTIHPGRWDNQTELYRAAFSVSLKYHEDSDTYLDEIASLFRYGNITQRNCKSLANTVSVLHHDERMLLRDIDWRIDQPSAYSWIVSTRLPADVANVARVMCALIMPTYFSLLNSPYGVAHACLYWAHVVMGKGIPPLSPLMRNGLKPRGSYVSIHNNLSGASLAEAYRVICQQACERAAIAEPILSRIRSYNDRAYGSRLPPSPLRSSYADGREQLVNQQPQEGDTRGDQSAASQGQPGEPTYGTRSPPAANQRRRETPLRVQLFGKLISRNAHK